MLSPFVYSGAKKKKSCPSELLGQENNSCGATRLGVSLRPLSHTSICRPLITERPTPSYILQKKSVPARQLFPLALGSPFNATFSAVIAPPTALCGKRDNAYFPSSSVFCIITYQKAFVNSFFGWVKKSPASLQALSRFFSKILLKKRKTAHNRLTAPFFCDILI